MRQAITSVVEPKGLILEPMDGTSVLGAQVVTLTLGDIVELDELGTYEMANEGNPESTYDGTSEALNDGTSETSLDGIDEDDILGLGVKGGMIGSFVGTLVRVCEKKELSNQYLEMLV